jgi:Tol biopolymer transport system component
MNPKSKLFIAACTLLSVALACQSATPELTAEVVSTSVSVSTSLPSPPTARAIPPAVPAASIAPPLGLFTGSVAYTGTDGQLYSLDMQTGISTPLTEGLDGGIYPFWSGDGSRIVYSYWNSAGERNGLAMLDVPSHDVRVVHDAFRTDFLSFSFSLSSDGSFAIYDTWNDQGFTDVYRMNMNSGESTIFTAESSIHHAQNSTLSPDDKRIAYQLSTVSSELFSIWTMNADGSGKVNLTPNDEFRWIDFLPIWSPDSAQVAFFRSYIRCSRGCAINDPTEATPGWPPGLWVINADGSGEHLLREYTLDELPGQYFSGSAWSPDGRYIAYYFIESQEESQEPTVTAELWIVDVATGESQRLVSVPAEHHHTFHFISWSPDSQAVMVNHVDAEVDPWEYTVYVAAVDGSGVWKLFDVNGSYFARWSP